MKIAICGHTGFLGNALARRSFDSGYGVSGISRHDIAKGVNHVAGIIDGATAVVNLAGSPVLKRWSHANKKKIYDSRINTTMVLTEAINRLDNPPRVMISASAVGIYGDAGEHDEYSNITGDGFLAKLCIDWEDAAMRINRPSTRLVIARLGVVISKDGGALKKMLPIFKLGLGGKIGNGLQPFPWVHLEDAINAICWFIQNNSASGVYNLVAPEMINNLEYTRLLAIALRKPANFTIPAFLLKIIYGHASGIITSGQRVVPRRLISEKFSFSFQNLEAALTNCTSRG